MQAPARKHTHYNLSIRVTDLQHEKLLQLARQTGTSRSWVLRKLIDDSELVAAPLFVAKRGE